MIGYERLLADFGQYSIIYAPLLAAGGALVASVFGMVLGNHKNGFWLRKVLAEVLSAAGVAAIFAGAIANSGHPLLIAVGAGIVWSLLYQCLRVAITRTLLVRYDHFADGYAE